MQQLNGEFLEEERLLYQAKLGRFSMCENHDLGRGSDWSPSSQCKLDSIISYINVNAERGVYWSGERNLKGVGHGDRVWFKGPGPGNSHP